MELASRKLLLQVLGRGQMQVRPALPRPVALFLQWRVDAAGRRVGGSAGFATFRKVALALVVMAALGSIGRARSHGALQPPRLFILFQHTRVNWIADAHDCLRACKTNDARQTASSRRRAAMCAQDLAQDAPRGDRRQQRQVRRVPVPPRSPESQGQPHHKKVSYAAAPGLRAVAARALRTPTRAQPQTKHVHILWG